ncbi:hypothetical protein HCA58_16820 [Micromonospora sp. HNM0581]|nr:hypothetical protein [Micromonospora sp. HNM0581]
MGDLRASGTVSKKRNIAAGEVSINGSSPILMKSVSGGATRRGTVANVGEPGNPQRLIPQVVRGGNNNRFFDTEFKILNQLANDLGPSSSSISGSVNLHTEFPVCDSCGSVISQFSRMFPGIRVTVTTG